MNIVPIIKLAASGVTALGTGAVVGNLVKATTPTDISKVQKVIATAGSFVVGGVLADLASRYVEGEIQQIADAITLARQTKSTVNLKESFDKIREEAADVAQATENAVKDTGKVIRENVEEALEQKDDEAPDTDAQS